MRAYQPLAGPELPPRARRIPFYLHGFMHKGGTTSACAENTGEIRKLDSVSGNYLRVRGEYFSMTARNWVFRELPPRARRIRVTGGVYLSPVGTTSACAENTITALNAFRTSRNYLRVRGEYSGGFS